MTNKFRLTYNQFIVLGFLLVILFGAALLSLPIATREGFQTDCVDALFTSTSATCVTGLIVFDTYSHWSPFGQGVILFLIQIGGLGFMAVISMFSIFLKRKISLKERKLIMHSSGTDRVSGAVHLLKHILIGTFSFELLGTIILSTRFIPRMGFVTGLYNALFHSVSAFCNAGFDLMGKYGKFCSLTPFENDYVVNGTIMGLIVVGGAGFLVWDDIINKGLHFKKYQLHTKIVLVATVMLIIVPTILFYFCESNYTLFGKTQGEKALSSMFLAVSPRTAGFNTVNLAELSDSGNLLTVFLMFIGGASGSTAGGIKVTTFVVMFMNVLSSARGYNKITLFKRTLDSATIRQAGAIVTVYLSAVIYAVLVICAVEPFGLKEITFEVTSAIGTAGLSMGGITPNLTLFTRGIIMLLMFGGRVGGMSLMLALAQKRANITSDRPAEKILIG